MTQLKYEVCKTAEVKLRAALGRIIDLDHHNHGPESRATKIARDALLEAGSRES